MRKMLSLLAMPTLAAALSACTTTPGPFGDDVKFLREHTGVIVLSGRAGNAQVAVAPAYQGRVMTSTAAGDKGLSFGWVNRELIASGKLEPHINAFGGEDRFWLGPEGGQFSIFFPKGADFDLEHWQTPALIDSEPFEVAAIEAARAVFTRTARITNYSGTQFDLRIERVISLLGRDEAAKSLGQTIPDDVKAVAYESDNTVTNIGAEPWKKETGLLSIWILGMFSASPDTTIVVPFQSGPEDQLGPIVNDEYFGKVPAERLIVKDGVMYFNGDACYRSKIGLTPQRGKPILGSYDAANSVLTLVQYTKPEGVTDYVNSMWELQDKPYAGDVVNSYNDGPTEGGSQLGQFYELETSSPAAALAPNASIKHVHRTIHLQGDEEALDAIAQATLGVGITEIKNALTR